MRFPTWEELLNKHCTVKKVSSGSAAEINPYFEDMASRRYNFGVSADTKCCRLVFLKGVLKNPNNKTLRRKGRFIWCKNLKYEGRGDQGLRQFSFTVDNGKKRFKVSENNVLCIPSKSYVNNNRFFRSRAKTFKAFSSVFKYHNALSMMHKNSDLDRADFEALIESENPFRPGTLIAPRLGYFYPENENISAAKLKFSMDEEHPCGIILGECHQNTDYSGREFYRVRFGDTTYERIHPIQMEIINEV